MVEFKTLGLKELSIVTDDTGIEYVAFHQLIDLLRRENLPDETHFVKANVFRWLKGKEIIVKK